MQAIDERSDGCTIRPINKKLPYIEKRYKLLKEYFSLLLKREEAKVNSWEMLINNLAELRPHAIPQLLPSELFPIKSILEVTSAL